MVSPRPRPFFLVLKNGVNKERATSSETPVPEEVGQGQVQANDTIRVVGLGKEIFHPETGILLSREEELLGELRITDVRESFSYAEPVSGTAIGKLKAGDKVVSTRKPEPYEYGPSWDMRGKLKKAVSN